MEILPLLYGMLWLTLREAATPLWDVAAFFERGGGVKKADEYTSNRAHGMKLYEMYS